MKKRLLIISIIVVVVAVFAGGTYAWFNANDSITNTFNVGGVTVEQIEQQRNPDTGELEDFENGKILAPVIDNSNAKDDPYGNFKDKIVTVKNIGKSSAYVQTYVAVPSVLDDAGIVHIYDTDAVSKGWIKQTDVDATKDGDQPFYITVIDGQKYNVYLYRHTKILQKDEVTGSVIDGVYLDMAVNKKDGRFIMDDKIIEGFNANGELFVYVCTQAMQSKNFDDYSSALNSGFPLNVESMPDFSQVQP